MNDIVTTLARSYDEAPYPGRAYAHTHPDYMAVLATLLGLNPPPVARCRVLEIGCAVGANLMPMALSLPEASFTGIDLSPRQIADGRRVIDTLGLTNITLLARDLQEVGDELGQFDYIIAHGVYSWTPAPVRDRLMALIKRCLTPNGVAFVSYNTYPGWHMLGAIRDLMLYAARDVEDSHDRARIALALLDMLAESDSEHANAFTSFIAAYAGRFRAMLDRLGPLSHAFLLHDALEVVNEPVYFAQFAAHAAQHGLQYLSETEFPMVLPQGLKPETVDAMRSFSRNGIDLEQYMDFLRGRQFRQTLLCHDHLKIRRMLRPERLAGMSVAALMHPESHPVDLTNETPVVFRNLHDVGFTVMAPITKAALLHLAEASPRAVPFETLVVEAQRRAVDGGAPLRDVEPLVLARRLGGDLLRAFATATTLVSFHLHPPLVASHPGERPQATALARLEAQTGIEVTNLYHDVLQLDPFDRFLLQLLDGQRDRAAIVREMAGAIDSGAVQYTAKESASSSPANLEVEIEQRLRWFAQVALLVA
ncbi:methyltransferase regulatory domain-containing protein [Roseiflexus castenholzii]|uniref:methyltransferase regulatory domain-containing protein n=1 Tax=Roseiflexus castenholzii TaxID=120962 RepID=UPI003C7A9CF0